MLNNYKSRLLLSTLKEANHFEQTLFKSIRIELGNHLLVKYLEMAQMFYFFYENSLKAYELNNLMIKEYKLKERVVNITLDDTCQTLFLVTEHRIAKICTSDYTERLHPFRIGSTIELVGQNVVVRYGNDVVVFDLDLKIQDGQDFTLQTIYNSNNTYIKIKKKQIELQTRRSQTLVIDFLQNITCAVSNTLLSHIFVGTDDGTIFVQSLENRPHQALKFLDSAVKNVLLSVAEDILIAYDNSCLVAICTKTFTLLERYNIENITNISVLDSFCVERVIDVIDIPDVLLLNDQHS